jgi:enoyl-CoA hydratase
MSAGQTASVRSDRHGRVLVVTLDRAQVANAIDAPTATALASAMREFDADDELAVAVLTGANGTFCAGADLKAAATGDLQRSPQVTESGEGPIGPSRLALTKPVIAAVEGHAVAAGLELAMWCDLRVASTDAVFGVFCRRWGIPLMDGGTVRLPRMIGHSNALDMILTGRGVSGEEALRMGLANRLVAPGEALATALELAQSIASRPQAAMRHDRASSYQQWSLAIGDALRNEYQHGIAALATGEANAGLQTYSSGAWRDVPPDQR